MNARSTFWIAATVFLLRSGTAGDNQDPYRYKEPVIFDREEKNPATGKTVFASKVWIMESDGSHARQVTTGSTYDDHPSFYSDLRHILYSEMPVNEFKPAAGARLIRFDVYTGEKEIYADVPGCALHHASLSPLGDLLVYHRDCGKRQSLWMGWGPGSYELTTVATNGVGLPDSVIFMQEKNKSVTPRQISIARSYGHGRGSKVLFLTDDCCENRRPAISPDAKLLAWQTNLQGGEDEIFLANIDGSNARNITNAKGNDGHPWFSRDGNWIVFESDRTGTWEIWKLNRETLQVEQLTHGGKQYDSTRPRM